MKLVLTLIIGMIWSGTSIASGQKDQVHFRIRDQRINIVGATKYPETHSNLSYYLGRPETAHYLDLMKGIYKGFRSPEVLKYIREIKQKMGATRVEFEFSVEHEAQFGQLSSLYLTLDLEIPSLKKPIHLANFMNSEGVLDYPLTKQQIERISSPRIIIQGIERLVGRRLAKLEQEKNLKEKARKIKELIENFGTIDLDAPNMTSQTVAHNGARREKEKMRQPANQETISIKVKEE